MKEQKTNMNWKLGLFVAVICLLVFMSSCGEQHGTRENKTTMEQSTDSLTKGEHRITSVSFKDETSGKVFADYQKIRTALTNDHSMEAKEAAEDMLDIIPEHQKGSQNMVLAMASTDDIAEQRQLFSVLTEKLEPVLKESLSGGTIYKQFCPMAFEGKGGYWLSVSEEIRNPYFGEKMLRCGTVKEVIHQ
ncbi:DUF3347 domain-containing protein [Pareuzebyella sediminis]|uniref:DUF3347 domain-containing protein n=1 Tax=Pareuzebyella sediminis TaxID=2607998 RepID=UPI0011ED2386|nr:DUF3347 domain-containing protein [Pareuzebyella sediminis]